MSNQEHQRFEAVINQVKAANPKASNKKLQKLLLAAVSADPELVRETIEWWLRNDPAFKRQLMN
jgi:hypothetical protein